MNNSLNTFIEQFNWTRFSTFIPLNLNKVPYLVFLVFLVLSSILGYICLLFLNFIIIITTTTHCWQTAVFSSQLLGLWGPSTFHFHLILHLYTVDDPRTRKEKNTTNRIIFKWKFALLYDEEYKLMLQQSCAIKINDCNDWHSNLYSISLVDQNAHVNK